MLETTENCIRNANVGYDKETANKSTTNQVANALKFVYGRLTDGKYTKKEKLTSIIKYLDSLHTEVYISMADYRIMHARLCAVIRYLINNNYADVNNQQMMVYLNVPASMYELNIKRDARARGLVECSPINCTITCINYLNMAFGMMLDSLGMYEDVVF